MPVSRRGLLELVAVGRTLPGGEALLAARGHEAYQAELLAQVGAAPAGQSGRGGAAGTRAGGPNGPDAKPGPPAAVNEIRISSNENPLGPGRAVHDAILGQLREAGLYPFNSSPNDARLVETIAALHKTTPDNVVLGAGSQEILRSAVRAFTSPFRPLVTAAPTFENCTIHARRMGHPVYEVKVDSSFRINLEELIATVRGAGLVFLNNPNNPTATVHPAKAIANFVERVRRISPDTVILIDEAYHDYVTDPNYATSIPLALSTPNVLVARTFSKAHGMAGLRIGYAMGDLDTIKPLERLKMPYNVSVLGIAAAMASLNDPRHIEQERARNTQVRDFTARALTDLGCKVTESHTNFLFVDVGRPAREFREACAAGRVSVGRDFPPFEHSHARISIGTMDEMRRATAVFRTVLRPAVPAAAGAGREAASC
jgi:histidinol-phosphate aminotransferase